jgi:hypothetical protein
MFNKTTQTMFRLVKNLKKALKMDGEDKRSGDERRVIPFGRSTTSKKNVQKVNFSNLPDELIKKILSYYIPSYPFLDEIRCNDFKTRFFVNNQDLLRENVFRIDFFLEYYDYEKAFQLILDDILYIKKFWKPSESQKRAINNYWKQKTKKEKRELSENHGYRICDFREDMRYELMPSFSNKER